MHKDLQKRALVHSRPHSSKKVSSLWVFNHLLLLDLKSKMQHEKPGCEAFLTDLIRLSPRSFSPDVKAADPHYSSVISHVFALSLLLFHNKRSHLFSSLKRNHLTAWRPQTFLPVKVLESSHSKASSNSLRASLVSTITCFGGFSACPNVRMYVRLCYWENSVNILATITVFLAKVTFVLLGGWWSSSHSSSSTLHRNRFMYLS